MRETAQVYDLQQGNTSLTMMTAEPSLATVGAVCQSYIRQLTHTWYTLLVVSLHDIEYLLIILFTIMTANYFLY